MPVWEAVPLLLRDCVAVAERVRLDEGAPERLAVADAGGVTVSGGVCEEEAVAVCEELAVLVPEAVGVAGGVPEDVTDAVGEREVVGERVANAEPLGVVVATGLPDGDAPTDSDAEVDAVAVGPLEADGEGGV